MIEEPYRWVEAIANRREYIETQIAGGSPIVALTYREGILLFTLPGKRLARTFKERGRVVGMFGHSAQFFLTRQL